MISREEAIQIAARQTRQGPALSDPNLAQWRTASLGEPIMVSDVWKRPSYWLVPVEAGGGAIGFVRVLGTGEVSAVGTYARSPAQADAAPATVTGISAAEAARQAETRIDPAQGETAQLPVYVHDGPPGREAWLVTVVRNRQPIRWLFVSRAGVYERPAGSLLAEGLE